MCEHKKIEILIFKLQEERDNLCFVAQVLQKVLFSKENNGKVPGWLYSHVKSLSSVIISYCFETFSSRSRSCCLKVLYQELPEPVNLSRPGLGALSVCRTGQT